MDKTFVISNWSAPQPPQPPQPPQGAIPFELTCCVDSFCLALAVDVDCRRRRVRRHRQCPPPEGATAAEALASRAAVIPNGPGYSDAPQCAAQGRIRAQKRPSPEKRPAPLLEVQQHAGIGYEIVQNLHVFAPQIVDQLSDILLIFAATLACSRAGCRSAQDLVRSWWRIAGLQGFHPDRVQQRRSFPRNAFLSGIVEQIVDTPVSRGGLQGFRPGQSSSSSSHRPPGISEDR